MSATYVLATEDPELLRAWWVLVPPGRQILTLDDLPSGTVVAAGIPTIVVVDAICCDRLPPITRTFPSVVVGEAGSSLLDRVRGLFNAKAVLSYEESRARLGSLFPILEELSERGSALDLLSERVRRGELNTSKKPPGSGNAEDAWEYIEGVVERLGSRARVLDEFRRIVRSVVNTSSAIFFLRDTAGYRADRGDASCGLDDPLCLYWSNFPSVLDGVEWPAPIDAMAEVAIRQRFRQWSARLLIPMHENAKLLGFIALGVRDDGQPYDANDRSKALRLGRLLRQCLEQSSRLGKLAEQNDRWRLAEHYLPNVLILGSDEPAPKHTPVAVRSLIASVRQTGEARRLTPSVDQPYRVSAGLVSDNLGVWVYWEDASADVREVLQQQRAARLELLHDIALTLNHELGNALVSLAALRHNPGAESSSPVLLAAIRRDIASLESINRHLASIPTFGEVVPEDADLRALLREVGRRTGVTVENSGSPVTLSMVPKLVEFALEAIIESIAENRPELGKKDLTMRLRSLSEADRVGATISIRGPKLALEGIWPTPGPGDAPSHGRISVFVAKEVIRLHGGDIRANQNTLGAEITIIVGNW